MKLSKSCTVPSTQQWHLRQTARWCRKAFDMHFRWIRCTHFEITWWKQQFSCMLANAWWATINKPCALACKALNVQVFFFFFLNHSKCYIALYYNLLQSIWSFAKCNGLRIMKPSTFTLVCLLPGTCSARKRQVKLRYIFTID